MNEITRKWQLTGLLDELSDVEKDGCALALNEVAKILIHQSEFKDFYAPEKHECFCGYILPMVRIGYGMLYPQKFPDINVFVKDFEEFFKKNEPLLETLNQLSDKDILCEMYQAHFSKTFMNPLKLVEKK